MVSPCYRRFFHLVGLTVFGVIICDLRAQTPTSDQGNIETGGKFVPKTSVGDQTATASPDRETAEEDLRKGLTVERLDSGKVRIGKVTLDQASRSIRFTATVNMTKGPVEYAVVAENGKVHESVFTTKASLRDIHLAMLLLGIKPAEARPGPDNSLQCPDSAAIKATVEWETNGPPVSRPLATLISLADGDPSQDTGRTLPDGRWLYKGSRFDAAGFQALREGSVISLIGDDSALLNNIGKDRERDDIHVPNTRLLPPKGMPVSIVLTCLQKMPHPPAAPETHIPTQP